jgi:ABC-type polysaccharide/polyol phosphate transport system ATPase subunit
MARDVPPWPSLRCSRPLLDEWLSVVDEKFSAKAEARLQKLVAQAGIVIIASHDQGLLRRVCNCIVHLDQGASCEPCRSTARTNINRKQKRGEHEKEDTGYQ